MNEKTKLISLAKVKRAMDKLKQVLTKKWFIALILAMIVCCGLAAVLYLPSIGLSYNQLKLGIKFSGFVAAAKIVATFGIGFLVICLAALAIGGLVAFGCSILFGGYKPSPDTMFKTAAESATIIVLVLLLTMGRYTSLTEEISESYSFSKNQLVEKMLVAHKKDVRRKHKANVELEVPKIGLAKLEAPEIEMTGGANSKLVVKEYRDKVVLMYAEKGSIVGERAIDITTALVKKSNFSYKKSKKISVEKEGFVWKNRKYQKAFSKYLDKSINYEMFDPEDDAYWVTAPTGFGTNLTISPEEWEKLSVNENNNEQNGGI